MMLYGLEEGTIVTLNESGEEIIKGMKIHILPIYEWLENPT
jgi:predicted AAA+ superfamily ATPase